MTRTHWPRLASLGVVFQILFSVGCVSSAASQRSPYDLVLKTAENSPFDLARLNGKVVLVTFFATWCFPCMVEVPALVKLQQTYERQGFSVVAVGMDIEGTKVLKPFVESYRISYPVLIADDEVLQGRSPFGSVSQIPTTFVINRSGKLVAAWSGPADFASLDRLISGLIN